MYVTIVYATVKVDKTDAFKQACKMNHEQSLREPGNLRFDILQSSDDPTHFVFYEAYRTQQDAAAHKQTAHYLACRDTVAEWMAEPRHGVVYQGLYPMLTE